jgi:dienelactone hydrolase
MITLQPLDYRHGEDALQGQLALPAGPGPHPAVLVMHESRGLGEQVRRRARMLAGLGYVALAADMYGKGADVWNAEGDGTLMLTLNKQPERLRGRVLAGFQALLARPEVDATRIGAIGFCFGGQCVLELARSGADVQSVVSFHGMLNTQLPAQPGAVKAKVLVLTGARDPYVPLAHVDGFREEMSAAGADWQVTIYGEGYHAFTDPNAADLADLPGLRYDSLLDRLSWASALAVLDATLR